MKTFVLRTIMIGVLVAISTAMAVIISPFTGWDDLTTKSPDIIIARCATTPEPMVVADGMIRSDIEVMSVLKGDTKQGAARMVSQYWPHQGERFLMFATYQSNQLYRAPILRPIEVEENSRRRPCRNLAEAARASTGCVNSHKVGLESLFPLPDCGLSDFRRSG